eukprot:IDg8399t1
MQWWKRDIPVFGLSPNLWNVIKFLIIELFFSVLIRNTYIEFLRTRVQRALDSGRYVTLVSTKAGRLTPYEFIWWSGFDANYAKGKQRAPKLVLLALNFFLLALVLCAEFGSGSTRRWTSNKERDMNATGRFLHPINEEGLCYPINVAPSKEALQISGCGFLQSKVKPLFSKEASRALVTGEVQDAVALRPGNFSEVIQTERRFLRCYMKFYEKKTSRKMFWTPRSCYLTHKGEEVLFGVRHRFKDIRLDLQRQYTRAAAGPKTISRGDTVLVSLAPNTMVIRPMGNTSQRVHEGILLYVGELRGLRAKLAKLSSTIRNVVNREIADDVTVRLFGFIAGLGHSNFDVPCTFEEAVNNTLSHEQSLTWPPVEKPDKDLPTFRSRQKSLARRKSSMHVGHEGLIPDERIFPAQSVTAKSDEFDAVQERIKVESGALCDKAGARLTQTLSRRFF